MNSPIPNSGAPAVSFRALLEEGRAGIGPKALKGCATSAHRVAPLASRIAVSPSVSSLFAGRKKRELEQSRPLIQTFAYNSRFNGQSYIKAPGQTVTIEQAITGPLDPNATTTALMRRLSLETGESICYTGRPETERKALEQVEFLFQQEWTRGKKGIRQVDGGYEFTYVVESMLDSSKVANVIQEERPRDLLDQEKETLEQLKGRVIFIPMGDGQTVAIRLNPILLHHQHNVHWVAGAEYLPGYLSGKDASDEISETGVLELKTYAMSLKTDERREHLIHLALRQLNNFRELKADQRVVYIGLLTRLLDLPLVLHCKHSKDRTSHAAAMVAALYHYMDKGMPTDTEDDFDLIVGPNSDKQDQYRKLFDHLVTEYLVSQIPVTRYALSAPGNLDAIEDPPMEGFETNGLLPDHLTDELLQRRRFSPLRLLAPVITVALAVAVVAIALVDAVISTLALLLPKTLRGPFRFHAISHCIPDLLRTRKTGHLFANVMIRKNATFKSKKLIKRPLYLYFHVNTVRTAIERDLNLYRSTLEPGRGKSQGQLEKDFTRMGATQFFITTPQGTEVISYADAVRQGIEALSQKAELSEASEPFKRVFIEALNKILPQNLQMRYLPNKLADCISQTLRNRGTAPFDLVLMGGQDSCLPDQGNWSITFTYTGNQQLAVYAERKGGFKRPEVSGEETAGDVTMGFTTVLEYNEQTRGWVPFRYQPEILEFNLHE
jgi:hypothetical protein